MLKSNKIKQWISGFLVFVLLCGLVPEELFPSAQAEWMLPEGTMESTWTPEELQQLDDSNATWIIPEGTMESQWVPQSLEQNEEETEGQNGEGDTAQKEEAQQENGLFSNNAQQTIFPQKEDGDNAGIAFNGEASGIFFDFYKSDRLNGSVYELEIGQDGNMSGGLDSLQESIPGRISLFGTESNDNEVLVTYKDASDLLKYRFTPNSEYSSTKLLEDSGAMNAGLWDVDDLFGYRPITLLRDGAAEELYILFFIKEENTGLMRYILYAVNTPFDEEDRNILFEKYEIKDPVLADLPNFVSLEEFQMWQTVRDVFRGNLEYVTSGLFRENEYSLVKVDFAKRTPAEQNTQEETEEQNAQPTLQQTTPEQQEQQEQQELQKSQEQQAKQEDQAQRDVVDEILEMLEKENPEESKSGSEAEGTPETSEPEKDKTDEEQKEGLAEGAKPEETVEAEIKTDGEKEERKDSEAKEPSGEQKDDAANDAANDSATEGSGQEKSEQKDITKESSGKSEENKEDGSDEAEKSSDSEEKEKSSEEKKDAEEKKGEEEENKEEQDEGKEKSDESSEDKDKKEEDLPDEEKTADEQTDEELYLGPTVPLEEKENEHLLNTEELSDETKMLLSSKKMRTMNGGALTLGASQEDNSQYTKDGITIEKLTARWLSASTGSETSAGFGVLELAPESDVFPNQQWQVDFALSGKGQLPAGSVEIIIPAYIWKNRSGKEPGLLTLAVPEEPDTSADFAWKRIGDNVVVTNARQISAGSKYMIQGTFRMTYPDPNAPRPFSSEYVHNMADIDIIDKTKYEYNGISDDFFAVLNITTPRTEEVITRTSNSIHATLSSYAHIAGAYKEAVGDKVYWKRPSNVPASLLPPNPDDYVYIYWYISGYGAGNQPYIMTFHDTLNTTVTKRGANGGESEEIQVSGRMLGATFTERGTVASPDGISVDGTIFTGYSVGDKASGVWVAYDKSAFTEEDTYYYFKNEVAVTVTGKDDGVSETRTAEAFVGMRTPIVWKINKVWIDDDNAKGRRPDSAPVWIDNLNRSSADRTVKSFVLNDENNWHAEWEDDGSLSRYDAFEYTYDVSRSTAAKIVSGVEKKVEYEDGRTGTLHWWYHRERTVYDEATHTWTFYNKYEEAWDWAYIVVLAHAKTPLNHQSDNQMSATDHDLNELRRGRNTTEIRYDVFNSTWALPYTAAEGADLSDESTYRQRYVTLEMIDRDVHFEGRKLDPSEYDITKVTMSPPTIKKFIPTGTDGEGTTEEVDPVPITMYGYTNGEWVKYAVLDSSGIHTYNGAYTQQDDVVFGSNHVSSTKAVLSMNEAYAGYKYTVTVVIHPSEQVQETVDELFSVTDYAMARVFNYSTSTLYNSDGDTVLELERYAPSYLHGRNYVVAADLKKSTVFTANDRPKRLLIFHNSITARQQSNVTAEREYKNAIADGDITLSKSGVFYDLLPPGMTADLSTVAIDFGQVIQANIIENYQNTGRQLLVVNVTLQDNVFFRSQYDVGLDYAHDLSYPRDGYGTENTLTFDMSYGYDEAMSRGLKNLKNYAAYEADEESLGSARNWQGENDVPDGTNNKTTGGAVDSDVVRGLLTNLDKERDDPSFVYSNTTFRTTETDMSALTSITKFVQVVGGQSWKTGFDNDVNAEEGQKYVYKIQVTSATDTTSYDLIILDSLENYQLKQDDEDYVEGEDVWRWKGKFSSIDISGIEEAGVAPVIYYSTVDNLNIDVETYNPTHEVGVVPSILEGPDWSTTPPEDLSQVKAIAIDCRFDREGNRFELDENESLIAYVYMQSPRYTENPEYFSEEDYTDPMKNAHAFNNVFMDVTHEDTSGDITHSYDHYDYTKVGIKSSDMTVEKIWDDKKDNDRIRPASIEVELMCDGEPTGRTITLSGTEDRWSGVFKHVPLYNEDGMLARYGVTEAEVPDYTSTSTVDGDHITIYNAHELYTVNVPFEKTWSSNEPEGWEQNIPQMVTFRLLADGEFTGKIMRIRKGADGRWTGAFLNAQKLLEGREIEYSVEEVKIPDFIMTQEGNVVNNEYFPYGDLSVEKHVRNGTTEALKNQFVFNLVLKNKFDLSLPDTGKYDYTISDSTGAEVETGVIGNGDSFSLKDGWKIVIRNIPSQTGYEITEDSSYGFTLSHASGYVGKIQPSECQEAVFRNTYASNGQVGFEATKSLTGRNLGRYQFQFTADLNGEQVRLAANAVDGSVHFGNIRYNESDDGKQFIYKLQEKNLGRPGYSYDDKVYYAVVVPHDNGDGTMDCVPVYYSAKMVESAPETCPVCSGTGTVWEDRDGNGEEEEYPCEECGGTGTIIRKTDETLEPIPCEVCEGNGKIEQDTDGDGVMEEVGCEACLATGIVGYRVTGEPVDMPSFTNEYHATGSLEMKAWKLLPQRTLQADEFDFLLQGLEEEGSSAKLVNIESKKNAADGTVSFSPIAFDETDVGNTYYYLIKEIPGNDETVIYDTNLYGYAVEVHDNGDGTLSFNQSLINVEDMMDTCDVCNGTGQTDEYLMTGQASVEYTYMGPAAPENICVFTFTAAEEKTEELLAKIGDSVPEITWSDGKISQGSIDVSGNDVTVFILADDFEDFSPESLLWNTPNQVRIGEYVGEFVMPDVNLLENEGIYTGRLDIPVTALIKTENCESCDGTGMVYNSEWNQPVILLHPQFVYDELNETLTVTANETLDYAEAGTVRTGSVTWADKDISVVNISEENQAEFEKVFENVAPDSELFGSDAEVKMPGDGFMYVGTFRIPAYEELMSEAVTVEAEGLKEGKLPVFRNMLKDGSLSITKTVAANGQEYDRNQEFTFKVKLIGLTDDKQIEYTTAQIGEKTRTIRYMANGGYFDNGEASQENLMTYQFTDWGKDLVKTGTYMEPVLDAYHVFDGWYLSPDGSGEPFEFNDADDLELPDSFVVYAKWKKQSDVKYAVTLFGIGEDVDEDGYIMGLTFGPAIGFDARKSFVRHAPSGLTEKGNAHRCIHDDDWETIVYWNSVDPFVYEQCVGRTSVPGSGCTHSVEILLSDKLKGTGANGVMSGQSDEITGDGITAIIDDIEGNDTGVFRWGSTAQWNQYYHENGNMAGYDTANGWSSSNIRAVLNGVLDETNEAVYAARNNITEETSLFGGFPECLRDAIGKKQTLYQKVASDVNSISIVYDNLWLFSASEWGYSGYFTNAKEGKCYSKTDVPLQSENNNEEYATYSAFNQEVKWLRSITKTGTSALATYPKGAIVSYVVNNSFALSPGFALSTRVLGRVPDAKYAVTLYGIGEDVDENGNWMGLTFGPLPTYYAMNSSISHTPTGTTAKGNAHRCIHNDSWETIVYWNNLDPHVYEQCLQKLQGHGCTHSVELYLNKALRNLPQEGTIVGDGTSVLCDEIVPEARVWNQYKTLKGYPTSGSDGVWYNTNGGWRASNIRAVLNGVDELYTNWGQDAFDASNPTVGTGMVWAAEKIGQNNSLLSCFPQTLQNAIGKKEVTTVQDYSKYELTTDDITYDKLWLPSATELGGNYYETEGQCYTIALDCQSAVGCALVNANGQSTPYWLRGASSAANANCYSLKNSAQPISSDKTCTVMGLAPCFALTTSALGKAPDIKYAVTLYGIGEDVDEFGNYMGLTFGPVIGIQGNNATDMRQAYISHEASGVTEKGNPHRCIHNDSWETIIYWNNIDPYVYEQCVGKTSVPGSGCTHSVEITLSAKLRGSRKGGDLSARNVNETGDGEFGIMPSVKLTMAQGVPSGIKFGQKWVYWTAGFDSADAESCLAGSYGREYPASNIRAFLNGVAAETDSHTAAYWENLTQQEAIIGGFPEILRNAIGKKAVETTDDYTDLSRKITIYDKLWLFSAEELGVYDFIISQSQSTSCIKEGHQYSKIDEKMYRNGNGDTAETNQSAFSMHTSGSYGRWLRTVLPGGAIIGLQSSGFATYYGPENQMYICPGFSLSTNVLGKAE